MSQVLTDDEIHATRDTFGDRSIGLVEFARSIEAAVLAKVLQARLSPAAWKCAKCSNVSDCEGVLPGDNWCNSCGAMDTMQPLHALKPAPMPNEGPSEGKL